jgi:hypothetical protein
MYFFDDADIVSLSPKATTVPTQFPPKASVVQPGTASLHASPAHKLLPPKPNPALVP